MKNSILSIPCNGVETDLQGSEFNFKGHSIAEIAEMYIKHVGTPVEGMRHMYYLKMANQFRHICENNETVLFSSLPELGQSADDRKRTCHDVCLSKPNMQIPRDLYFTLVDNGILQAAATMSLDAEADASDDATLSSEDDGEDRALPRFPKVIASYARISPIDFVWAQVNSVVCMLGANMNIKAEYIDRVEHTPTFLSVVVGPPSCGKSFIKNTRELLTANMRERDIQSEIRYRKWLEEYELTKNTKHPTPRPRLPRRVLISVTSQVRLLKRLDDTQGAHALFFMPELDTMVKSNKGYQDKTDLMRQAYDNDMYGQDYMSENSFSGEVRLTFNMLSSGTPGALYRMFPNPENGFVSRLTISEITNQQFAEFQPFRSLTDSQKNEIESLVNWCNEITYVEPGNLECDLVRPRIDITEQAKFLHKVILQWLDEKLDIAIGNGDIALDGFRKRCAVMGFRAGLVAIGCYKLQLNDTRRQIITEFVRWFADMALENLLHFYRRRAEIEADYIPARLIQPVTTTLFDILPDEFTINDVRENQSQFGIVQPAKNIVYEWKKAHMIDKVSHGKYRKSRSKVSQKSVS